MNETAPKLAPKLELTGKRIILRNPTPADTESMQRILSDPLTMRYLQYMAHLPQGWSIEQVEKRHQEQLEDQAKQRGAGLIVRMKANLEVVGCCGFNTLDLQHKRANFGRILHHTVWGKGIASECLILSMAYAFEEIKLNRVEFTTMESNTRSRKSMEKSGFFYEGIRKGYYFDGGQYKDACVYVLFANEWPEVRKKLSDRLERQISEESSRV